MWGALSDERTGLWLQLLLALASVIIFGFKSHGTHDHILLSQIRDFPFCHLLQLAGLEVEVFDPASTWDTDSNAFPL
jgi:hypothetical protein